MYSPSLALFNFDTDDLFCVKYQETRNVSLLGIKHWQICEKRDDIQGFF